MSDKESSDCQWHYMSYSSTKRFGSLVLDYLNSSQKLKEFYEYSPEWNSFGKQIENRSSFSSDQRQVLVEVLQEQYSELESKNSLENEINSLLNSNTFTVTTGQQLCLFTGPLYVIYKAVHVIKLAKELQSKFPENHFVPIFWLASEDHDFEEVNHVHFGKNRFSSDRSTDGAVGRTPLPDLQEIIKEIQELMGPGKTQTRIVKALNDAFAQSGVSWSLASRKFMHELFGTAGLILLDADDSRLKKLMIPAFKEELINGAAAKAAAESSESLDKLFKVQAFPRDINLFYLDDQRKRIVKTENGFTTDGGHKNWSEEQILSELEIHPERFSPNVLLRPLYQEVILPNLAYIGGGAEVAYWAQLKGVFDHFKVPMPIILLRQSVQLITKAQIQRMKRAELEIADLFNDPDNLVKEHVSRNTEVDLELRGYEDFLKQNFDEILQIAKSTDKSMIGAVEAQRAKQTKGLENLKKKLLRAEKKKFSQEVERIEQLLDDLFPNGGLQERRMNWIEAELLFGGGLIEELIKGTDPLGNQFACILMNN